MPSRRCAHRCLAEFQRHSYRCTILQSKNPKKWRQEKMFECFVSKWETIHHVRKYECKQEISQFSNRLKFPANIHVYRTKVASVGSAVKNTQKHRIT